MLENTQNNQDNPQTNGLDNLADDLGNDLVDNLWDVASPGSASKEPTSTPTVEANVMWGGTESGDLWDDIEASVTDLVTSLGIGDEEDKKPKEEEHVSSETVVASRAEYEVAIKASSSDLEAVADIVAEEVSDEQDEKTVRFDLGNVLDSLSSGEDVNYADTYIPLSHSEKQKKQDADDVEMTDVDGDLDSDGDDVDSDFNFDENAFSSMDIMDEDDGASSKRSEADDHVKEIVSDKGTEEVVKKSAASAELNGLLQMDKSGDSSQSEEVTGEIEAASDEDEEEDEDGIRLSERARLGRVIPEGEVITSEHTLGHDVIYAEADCSPDVPAGGSHVLKVLVTIAIALIAVTVIVAFYMRSGMQQPEVHYIQKGAFQNDNGQFKHLYYSSARNHIAMCSDVRGVVWSGGKMVSEFWPGNGGCARLVLADDGTRVWYMDNNHQLFEVNLIAGFGFNPKLVTSLNGIVGDEFAVSNGAVSYFAQNDDLKPVYRSVSLESKEVKDVAIPDDALPCSGFAGSTYAYVSKDAIHLNAQAGETVASLEAPKLGCSRETALSCSMNGAEDWVVLCKDSIRQGKGKNAQEPNHYNNVALRSGASTFNLIRHNEGTELVTTEQWIRLDNRNNMVVVPLKQPLNNGFEVAYHTDEKAPLIGLNNDIIKFTIDGQNAQYTQVIPPRDKSTNELLGAAFVGDGSHAVSLASNYTEGKSRISLWDLQEGRLVNSTPFNGIIEKINISNQGRYGFVVNELNSGHITWINWLTGELMGEFMPEFPVENVVWSADDQHVLIQYINRNADLFEVTDKAVKPMRSYTADVVVSFADNDLLWHIEGGEVYFERISDSSRSVVNEKLSEHLGETGISHILAHPYSDDVLFWGEGGIWRYNVATKRLNLVSSDEISWLIPDRSGNYVATSSGLIELSTLEMKALPELADNAPLRWIGYKQYLQTADGRSIIDWQSQQVQQVLPDVTKLRFVGLGGGEHPTNNYALSIRNNILSLEQLQSDAAPRTVSAFGGEDTHSWCWISANGEIQAQGNTCVSFMKDAEGKSLLSANNAAISASMKPLLSSAARVFEATPIEFIDKVKLNITTVPEDAFLVFATAEGELPQPLTFEDGIVAAPFTTELSLDTRWFALVVAAAGYESRTMTFRPDRESIGMRIPLLPENASAALQIRWLSPADDTEAKPAEVPADNQPADGKSGAQAAPNAIAFGDPVEVSEDLDIEMKALAFNHVDALTTCLKKQHKPHHLLLALHDNQLVVADPALEEAAKTCVAPVVSDLNDKHANGALPELSDMANLYIDIQLSK